MAVRGLVAAAVGLVAAGRADAQAAPSAAVDSLRREIAALRAQIDSLRETLSLGARGAREPAAPRDELAALRAAAAAAVADTAAAAGAVARLREAARAVAADTAAPQDSLAELRAAAEAAARSGETQPQPQTPPPQTQFIGRERSLQALNPEISVNTDVFTFLTSDSPDEDNFVPREFEISLQAPLDPYSRAKIFVSYHAEGGTPAPFGEVEGVGGHGEGEGSATEVEEGYVQWVNLPGGLGLSLGKIRQRLGTLNRWHRHALPAQSLPLPYLAWLGEEGLAQTGASLYWLAPVHGFGTYELWMDVMRSGNESMFGESRKPNVLGHLNAFWELSPATYFEIGASGLVGRYEEEGVRADAQLFSVETAFNWRPPERSLYRDLTLRAALLLHRRDPLEAPGGDVEMRSSFGAYALGEYRLSQRWVAGLRYDYVENPDVDGESAWMLAPTLTWWQSEWVRIRAEYDLLDGPDQTMGQFLIQFTFAMGPHKHETY